MTFKGFNPSAAILAALLLSGGSGHLMRKIANAACFVLRAVVLCPRRAPELSKLAVAGRR
jgi:hypothetical protein